MPNCDQSTRVYEVGEVIKTYDLPHYFEPDFEQLIGGMNTIQIASNDPIVLEMGTEWCRRHNCYLYQSVRNSDDLIGIPCSALIVDRNYIGQHWWQNYLDFQQQLIDEGYEKDAFRKLLFRTDLADGENQREPLPVFLETLSDKIKEYWVYSFSELAKEGCSTEDHEKAMAHWLASMAES